MPYDVSVDDATRTIHVRGYGSGTTADTLELIGGLKDTLRRCAGYDILYDGVALRIESSPADMVKVADALFGEAGAVLRRFAIVVPPARVPLGHIFAALADPYRVTANVFGDVEAARDWLAVRRRDDPGPAPQPPLETP